MKSQPLVNINIVTYNNEKTIEYCLQSVFQQSYKHIRVCVADNASTDNTVKILSNNPVEVTKNTSNFGYAMAHNQMLRMSHGKYILTLNPDVVLDSRFIQNLVCVMENNPLVGSASGLLLRVEDIKKHSNMIDAAGIYMRRNRRQGLRHEHEKRISISNPNEYIFGPDGAASFYRRKMLLDIRYRKEIFDEDFYMYKEDVDICWRAQLYGWKSFFIPSSIAYHKRSFRPGERIKIPQHLRLFSVRNRYFLMIKNELAPLFFRDFFKILIYEIKIMGYICIREPSSIPAYVQVIKKIPLMMNKRKDIQKHKRVDVHYMKQWFTS